jgi:hypothetical protein
MVTSISRVRLKSGSSLEGCQKRGVDQAKINSSLKFPEAVLPELYTLLIYVDPKTSMPANGRSTLNRKSHNDRRICPGGEINIAAGDIWRAVVIKRQEVDLIAGCGFGRHHQCFRSSSRLLDSKFVQAILADCF